MEHYPDYPRTHPVDDLRRHDFSRSESRGEVCLDYTGRGLYPESLIRGHAEWLESTLLGNPHSENPASQAGTEAVERVAARSSIFSGLTRQNMPWSSPPTPALP